MTKSEIFDRYLDFCFDGADEIRAEHTPGAPTRQFVVDVLHDWDAGCPNRDKNDDNCTCTPVFKKMEVFN